LPREVDSSSELSVVSWEGTREAIEEGCE